MKHIVTSGCSFAEDTGTWSTILRWYSSKFNIKVWNYGCGSRGNFWIRRSISSKVFDLLEEGVSPSDIYVIASWSTSHRIETPIDHTLWELESGGKYNFTDETIPGRGLSSIGDVKYLRYSTKWGKRNKFHDGSLISDASSYDGGKSFWSCCYPTAYEYHAETMLKFNQEKYAPALEVINYYEQILFLQNYLDLNKINYLFFSMRNLRQNIFDGDDLTHDGWWHNQFKWNKDSKFDLNGCRCSMAGCEQYREQGSWTEPQYSRMITPDVKDCPMMEQSFPHIEPIMKQINWDKWWFYKNEKNDWGGSLEWTHEETDFPHYECGPKHPMMHSWFYFFWKILRPRMEIDGIYTSTENSFYDRIKKQYENPIVPPERLQDKWKEIIT